MKEVEKIVARLKQEDKERRDAAQKDREELYEAMLDVVEEVSQAMKIDSVDLLRYAYWVTDIYGHIEWTDFLIMLKGFYSYKRHDEEEKAAKRI